MEKTQKKALISALKNIKTPTKKNNTDFLENASILKIIGLKIKEGATIKEIHLAILSSGYKLSFSAFKIWISSKYPKN